MNLQDFVHENRISIKRLSSALEIPYHRVYNIYLKATTPTLIDCLKIIYATDSKLQLESLFSEKDKKEFDEFIDNFKGLDMKSLKRYKVERD